MLGSQKDSLRMFWVKNMQVSIILTVWMTESRISSNSDHGFPPPQPNASVESVLKSMKNMLPQTTGCTVVSAR